MDVGAVLIQLKPDVMGNVEAWQTELNIRKTEAIETLKAEGVFVESWFHVEIEGKDYLIAYTRAENISKAQELARNSQFPIDAMHKAFKENWDKKFQAKLLVDLERSDNENE